MKTAIIFFTFISLGIKSMGQDTSAVEKLRSMVIQIECGGTKGSGFVIGKTNDSIYVITAKHVIANAGEKVISLSGLAGNAKVTARKNFVDPGEDLAVISAFLPSFVFRGAKMETDLDPNSEFFYIKAEGDKAAVGWQERYLFRSAQPTLYKYEIYAENINEGDSGGAIFETEKSKIIGIVLSGTDRIIQVLSINRIKSLLTQHSSKIWQLE